MWQVLLGRVFIDWHRPDASRGQAVRGCPGAAVGYNRFRSPSMVHCLVGYYPLTCWSINKSSFIGQYRLISSE